MRLPCPGAKLAFMVFLPIEGILNPAIMTQPRISSPFIRRALAAALVCACFGTPVAAQDGPKPVVGVVAVASAVAGVPGEEREVRALRDPQVVVTRLQQPAAVVASIAEDSVSAPGTMLLVMGGLMLWIAGRRR